MTFCIRRTREYVGDVVVVTYWDGHHFISARSEKPAKAYVRRRAAEKTAERLVKRCQAFSDEIAIVEYT